VKIVQETGIDEISVEEDGMRISVRRTPELPFAAVPAATSAPEPGELEEPEIPPRDPGLWRVESPMVGTFYRAASPDEPPFVEEGDPVAEGQTLCILEAMKLMNPVKAEIEGVVRKIHVGNAEPVEYGQLLFELEPTNGRPLGI
jgi:oxaloacetate decarboxylase alpha subunit